MIQPDLLVLDTIYGAGCAKLRAEVELAGAKWADGLGMLLHQGAEAFRLWTGREAPLEIMRPRAALVAGVRLCPENSFAMIRETRVRAGA